MPAGWLIRLLIIVGVLAIPASTHHCYIHAVNTYQGVDWPLICQANPFADPDPWGILENPLTTPARIVPPVPMLAGYAVLRAATPDLVGPNAKVIGVYAAYTFYLMPLWWVFIRWAATPLWARFWLLSLPAIWVGLTICGAMAAEGPVLLVSQVLAVAWFQIIGIVFVLVWLRQRRRKHTGSIGWF